jgi:hypothetical protein
MKMSNKVYDVLKWIAMIFLPALGTLYFALAKIWGFPYPAEHQYLAALPAVFSQRVPGH